MYILLNYCEKYSEPSKKKPGLQISRKKLFENGLRFFWYIYRPLNKEIEIVLYEKHHGYINCSSEGIFISML